MTIEINGHTFTPNPNVTDLHISVLASAVTVDNEYISVDSWAMIAKQLCFIFADEDEDPYVCEFAMYDPATRDGELFLTLSTLISILNQLQTWVNAKASVDAVELTEQLVELESTLESLNV